MPRVKGKFSVEELFTPEAVEDIRAVIADCGGNEVFILGRLDNFRRVCEVEPLAFGSEEEVPAILGVARPGDVIIHNHPSGELTPSSADNSIASQLASENIGSYIVDNAVKRVYVIFRPMVPEEYVLLEDGELAGYFTPSGELARAQPDFEFRPQQVAMVKAIAQAFNKKKIAVIEAGTGVGKSFAYLIPAILWSIRNKERVVISTHTINLQEQLIHKDIPFLRENLNLKFSSALIKGRNNYICLRKVDTFGKELGIFPTKQQEAEAKEIIAWARSTNDGTLSELNIKPDNEVWEQFVSESDSCTRIKCPYYHRCFYYKARRSAAQVNIIVANHHIVMADISIRAGKQNYSGAGVIPHFTRLIIDEAHHLEEVATSYFGTRVTHYGITKLLGGLVSKKSARGRERGILPVLRRKIFNLQKEISLDTHQDILDLISNKIIPQRYSLQEEINQAMRKIRQEVFRYALDRGIIESEDEQIKLRITDTIRTEPIWTEVILPNLNNVSSQIAKYSLTLRNLAKEISSVPVARKQDILDMTLELHSRSNRLEEISGKLNLFCSDKAERCYWIELSKGKSRSSEDGPLHFCTAPINVGDSLRQEVFNKLDTVVMTSATLTVDNKFDYFLRQIGLENTEEITQTSATKLRDSSQRSTSDLLLLQLDTPFRFEQQAIVGVPVDFPEPPDVNYPEELEKFLQQAIGIVGGSTLVLFTSYRLMDDLYHRLSEAILRMGYPCMKQGEEPRHRLLTKFRDVVNSVLFATASFWEGIDVKGESLRCLILTRLPFRVPTEPIMEAKVEYLEKQGKDAFRELVLPWAVMRFRQGFGRLIRSRTDKGAIIITDRRLVTRWYGDVFLRSLPTTKFSIVSTSNLLEQLKHFFEDNPR